MTGTDFEEIFEAYLDAFAATFPAEQERLLRFSVADNVVYTNPGVKGKGQRVPAALLGHHSQLNGSVNSMDNSSRSGPRWARWGKTSSPPTAMAVPMNLAR